MRNKRLDSGIQCSASAVDGGKKPKPVGSYMFLVDRSWLREVINERTQAL